jgi:DNA invertase Pin-like site-specific DNA recombinase
MQAFAYLRVSTDQQAEEGVSLEAQEERFRAWCVANGHDLGGIFTDAGLSGKRADNRPGLQSAKSAAIKSSGLLVVYSLSRLARSIRDSIDIAEELDRSGASLVSLSEQLDCSTAAGRMLFNILSAQCQFEREVIAERTRAALAYKKKQGQRVGGIPFGYDLAADGIHLEENAREQEVIAIIQGLRSEGLSVRKIAEELNRLGHRTKKGCSWSYNQVHRTLRAISVPA